MEEGGITVGSPIEGGGTHIIRVKLLSARTSNSNDWSSGIGLISDTHLSKLLSDFSVTYNRVNTAYYNTWSYSGVGS